MPVHLSETDCRWYERTYCPSGIAASAMPRSSIASVSMSGAMQCRRHRARWPGSSTIYGSACSGRSGSVVLEACSQKARAVRTAEPYQTILDPIPGEGPRRRAKQEGQ